MRTRLDYTTRLRSRRLAGLKSKTSDLERKLWAARASFDRELAHFTVGRPAASRADYPGAADTVADARGGQAPAAEGRTETLVNHGRSSTYAPGLSLRRKAAIGAALATALGITLAITLSGGAGSWPASVATVQSQAERACQNPDVKSEPSQVNFACAKDTRQILWVFALMTSNDNPDFADEKTGRRGLEPITPAQGGEIAWSLNLHHPYNPANPVDSLAVAARAINNIIGGATVIGAHGTTVVQPGLESQPANCARYTGSAALTSRAGYPSTCAQPVTVPGGQAALVADVYQKWIVGAPASAAQDAAVLFQNAGNPGNPQVQSILKRLSKSPLVA
jgi:hypothetical protein